MKIRNYCNFIPVTLDHLIQIYVLCIKIIENESLSIKEENHENEMSF